MRVHSLQEAHQWFLEHSEGTLLCVDGADEQECVAYPEAELFYNAPILGAHPDDLAGEEIADDEIEEPWYDDLEDDDDLEDEDLTVDEEDEDY